MTDGGDTETDDALVALAAGDLAALERLYRDLRAPIFGVALAILGDRPAAEDVAHDTFVRLWERADGYRGGTSPRAWVLTIARNLAIDVARRHRASDAVPVAEAAPDPRLDHSSLVAALLTLAPTEREIVVLHVLGGLTHAEIAVATGLPAGTVRWRYRIALRRLEPLVGERDV